MKNYDIIKREKDRLRSSNQVARTIITRELCHIKKKKSGSMDSMRLYHHHHHHHNHHERSA